MHRPISLALAFVAAFAATPHARAQATPAKKELVQKVLQLQQPGFETMARELASQPALRLMQAAGNVIETQIPAARREAVGKAIEADLKKYVDEATPVIRERVLKLAPATYGQALEEKFTEDELKQLIAWLESPVNRKFQQAAPEIQNAMVQKVMAESTPLLDPKFQALQQRVRTALGITGNGPGAAQPAAPAPSAPARPASK